MFVTHSKTPYEVRWTSPAGQEVEVIQIHLAVGVFLAAVAASITNSVAQNSDQAIRFTPPRAPGPGFPPLLSPG